MSLFAQLFAPLSKAISTSAAPKSIVNRLSPTDRPTDRPFRSIPNSFAVLVNQSTNRHLPLCPIHLFFSFSLLSFNQPKNSRVGRLGCSLSIRRVQFSNFQIFSLRPSSICRRRIPALQTSGHRLRPPQPQWHNNNNNNKKQHRRPTNATM